MTLLSCLPDDLYRESIAKLLFADVLHQVEYGGGTPVYPVDFYYCFCAGNSDYVRARYLADKWNRDIKPKRGYKTLQVRDWFKLLIDLERPVVWTSAIHGWRVYSVRQWQAVSNGVKRGGLYWNSTYEKPMLTYAGWSRLSHSLSMDKSDARMPRVQTIKQVWYNQLKRDYDEFTTMF